MSMFAIACFLSKYIEAETVDKNKLNPNAIVTLAKDT
jgi:hypothetical protein